MDFKDDKELYEYKTNYRIKLVKEISTTLLKITLLIVIAIPTLSNYRFNSVGKAIVYIVFVVYFIKSMNRNGD